MLRVPGSRGDLLTLKSRGADVRVVYSPLDAVQIARDNPDKRVVFFGVGFETTAPANAMAVHPRKASRRQEFLDAGFARPGAARDGGRAECARQSRAGISRTRTRLRRVGYREYESLCDRYHVPIVVTGFEPIDLLEGILMTVRQLEAGRAEVENQYVRAVTRDGNRPRN